MSFGAGGRAPRGQFVQPTQPTIPGGGGGGLLGGGGFGSSLAQILQGAGLGLASAPQGSQRRAFAPTLVGAGNLFAQQQNAAVQQQQSRAKAGILQQFAEQALGQQLPANTGFLGAEDISRFQPSFQAQAGGQAARAVQAGQPIPQGIPIPAGVSSQIVQETIQGRNSLETARVKEAAARRTEDRKQAQLGRQSVQDVVALNHLNAFKRGEVDKLNPFIFLDTSDSFRQEALKQLSPQGAAELESTVALTKARVAAAQAAFARAKATRITGSATSVRRQINDIELKLKQADADERGLSPNDPRILEAQESVNQAAEAGVKKTIKIGNITISPQTSTSGGLGDFGAAITGALGEGPLPGTAPPPGQDVPFDFSEFIGQ